MELHQLDVSSSLHLSFVLLVSVHHQPSCTSSRRSRRWMKSQVQSHRRRGDQRHQRQSLGMGRPRCVGPTPHQCPSVPCWTPRRHLAQGNKGATEGATAMGPQHSVDSLQQLLYPSQSYVSSSASLGLASPRMRPRGSNDLSTGGSTLFSGGNTQLGAPTRVNLASPTTGMNIPLKKSEASPSRVGA